MTLARDDAKQFWNDDLSEIEKRFLGERRITELPAMKEDWRVPNQGTVLAFSTVDIDSLVKKPSLLRAWVAAVFRNQKG